MSMQNLRDVIRGEILKSRKLKSVEIEFFGQKIEIRQPTLEGILTSSEEGNTAAVIQTLLKQAYVPGTEELVFESGDVEVLKKLPFGPDWARVSDALKELTDVDFPTGSDTSSETPSG